MTDIPGTSIPTAQDKPQEIVDASSLPSIEPEPTEFQIINIEEIKKKAQVISKDTFFQEPKVWYKTLRGWVGVGIGVGIVIALIGIRYPQFFILAAVCPIIAVISWYVWLFAQKYEKHDVLGKQ